MNSSGITRRVDELGRIVIPVEIRRLLNIKEGEKLEFIINNEYICLKKSSHINFSYNLIDSISQSINDTVDGDYFISDRERIIVSSNSSLLEGKLNSDFIDLLNKHEESIIHGGVTINNVEISNTLYIYPYYLTNDIAGFITIYNVDNIDKYKKLLRFISSYIHNQISIS